jgi:hypothetical protein
MQVNGWHSDRKAERRRHAALPLLAAAIAYGVLSFPIQSVVVTIGWFTLAGGLIAYISTFWAIPTGTILGGGVYQDGSAEGIRRGSFMFLRMRP